MGGKGSLDEDSLSKEFENKVLISDKARVTEEAKNNVVDNKITIMTINVKNNRGLGVFERRKYFENLITEKKPHVILSQECNETDLGYFINYDLIQHTPLNENYPYEATILKKNDVTENILGVPKEFENSHRLALGRVEIGEGCSLYIGSWHGLWNKPSGEGTPNGRRGKLSDSDKKDYFIGLRKFMSEIVCMEGDKVNHHPWIVGGDFNIEHEKVNTTEHLGGNAKIVHTFDNMIYYLCSPELFEYVEEVDKYIEVDSNILDHKPAMLTIDKTKYKEAVEKVEVERKLKAETKAMDEQKEEAVK